MALSGFCKKLFLALPEAGRAGREDWFNEEFYRIGEESAQRFGFTWLQTNVIVRDALMSAGLDTSNPVIRWLAYVVARGFCLKLEHDAKEKQDDLRVQAT